LIEKIYYKRKFHKKQRQLLLEASERRFVELVERFTSENLRKAEKRFGEFNTETMNPDREGKLLFTKILLGKEDSELYSGHINRYNIRSGFGMLLDKKGCKYIGNWSNNYLNGFGRFIDEEGNIYEGIFENNLLKEGS
jgi:hypothetical protein